MRQTSVTPAGFEPAIPASERPQTRLATGIGTILNIIPKIRNILINFFVIYGISQKHVYHVRMAYGPPSLKYNEYRVFLGGKAAGAWG